jgi:3-oxoacyl-[acyl-carrier-protein] synthase II
VSTAEGGRRRVVVTGAGVVCPLGDTPADLHGALCAGRSGLGPVELFPTDGLGCRWGGEIRQFSPARYLGEGNLRPLDRTGCLAAAAAGLALAASGWTRERRAERDVGLVLGTTFGSVHTISQFDRRGLEAGPAYVKPLDFANSVINAAAGQAAIWHDLRGVNATLAGGPVAAAEALAYAADLIRGGHADSLLAGGADELCFESFLGYQRAGLVAGGDGSPPLAVPFAAGRNGFLLAEGAALLMLEEAEAAAARGATILGELCGWGAAFDPSRGADGRRSGRAMSRAVRLALADAGIGAADLDCVFASASGRPAGDRAEAGGLACALEGALDATPVTSAKSLLGETLGAGAALHALAFLESARTDLLPGIHGLGAPEEGLPFAPCAENLPGHYARGLVIALGLDGQACALVLGGAGGD